MHHYTGIINEETDVNVEVTERRRRMKVAKACTVPVKFIAISQLAAVDVFTSFARRAMEKFQSS